MYYISDRYSSSKKQTFDGVQYQSGFEAGFALDLARRQQAGEIKKWQRQVKIPLIVNEYLIANYYIDFIIHHNNGVTEYVETKGGISEIWRMKWKLFESLYSELPDVKLSVVKQKSFNPRKNKRL